MSARARQERFERAVQLGRIARDSGRAYTDNPYRNPNAPGGPTSGAAISYGAWSHGWVSRDSELRA